MVTVSRATPPAPGSKLLDDRDLPFTILYPPAFRQGRDDPTRNIRASLLIDRWNAIVFTEFGPVALSPDRLERALKAKLSVHAGAPPLNRELLGGNTILTLTLPPTRPVAGKRVGAKRLYLSAGGRVWEISCQFTRESRARVIRACDQIGSSLRPAAG